MQTPTRLQFFTATALLALVVISGALLLRWSSHTDYTLFESIYFALITVSTVGYGELPQMASNRAARIIAMLMIVAGVGAVAFFQATMTAVFVQGAIGKAFRRRRMDKKIAALTGHIVVAGAGRTGRFVIEELAASHRPFAVIDLDEPALMRLAEDLPVPLLYVIGNATDDDFLIAAGVERASGLVAALTEDRDNLFVTVSARSLNPGIRIASKAVSTENEAKLVRAGADATVSPHRIGGRRLVTELVRPYTAEFLDRMMTGNEQLRFEDIEIHKGGLLDGRSLRQSRLRERGNVLVVAVRDAEGNYTYNPPADLVLKPGWHIVVLGQPEEIQTLMTKLRGAR